MNPTLSGSPKTHTAGSRMLSVALLLFSALSFLCFFAALWYVSVYGRLGFDSVLYTLTSDLGGVQSGLIVQFLLCAALPAVLCTAAVGFLLFFPWKKFFSSGGCPYTSVWCLASPCWPTVCGVWNCPNISLHRCNHLPSLKQNTKIPASPPLPFRSRSET